MAQVEQRHNDHKAVANGMMPTVIRVTLSDEEARNGALVIVLVDKGSHTDDVGYVQVVEDEDYDDDGNGTSNGALYASAGLLANDDDNVGNTYPEYFTEVTA